MKGKRPNAQFVLDLAAHRRLRLGSVLNSAAATLPLPQLGRERQKSVSVSGSVSAISLKQHRGPVKIQEVPLTERKRPNIHCALSFDPHLTEGRSIRHG